MYLSEVYAENFRIFGPADDDADKDRALRLTLQPGINVLVGENDSGKTAIVDAIRYCLWTTSLDYHRFSEDDFHCDATGRAQELMIRCKFDGLAMEDQSTFLEWLTTPARQPPVLYVTLRARRLDVGRERQRVAVIAHAGEDGEGPALEGAMRELIRATFLRPLRDADSELSPGRNSRLSQILASHPDIASQTQNDFDETADKASTLVGIMRRAEHHVASNRAVVAAKESINTGYLSHLSIADDDLTGEIGIAGSSLRDILEKLELRLAAPLQCSEWTKRGLGFNNALFMAAELLLLGASDACPTLLIEEPEAHLHPQLQARVIDLLESKSDPAASDSVQVILTTHSPNLASAVRLQNVTLVCAGRTFSLAPEQTMLAKGDYAFLERFLDVTKANLFFAKAVVIVEGDAESLLLPAIAKRLGRSFSERGVSVVKVGHTGLFRYGNIFRRIDGQLFPVRVACLRDRDVVPDDLPAEMKGKLKSEADLSAEDKKKIIDNAQKRDGGSVCTFVSDHWTFEYDLARSSWTMAKVMHQAIKCAEAAPEDPLNDKMFAQVCSEAAAAIDSFLEQKNSLPQVALSVFLPVKENRISKTVVAQYAAKILEATPLSVDDLPAYLAAALEYVAPSKKGPSCDQPSA